MIGLVNTPEGQRIKLIRNESIGKYSWDTSASNVNSGYGVNEWSTSKMKELLNNGAYYNRSSGTCYNGRNNATTPCDFSETGLTESAKEMIDTITWNTGSNGAAYSYDNINTETFYNIERSASTGRICSGGADCNDNVVRTTTWVGQIGLMYLSDYGYATSEETEISREVCINNNLYQWDSFKNCYQNNWIFAYDFRWALTPIDSSKSYYVFYVSAIGAIRHSNANNQGNVLPALYLRSNVNIVNGNGTEEMPFELSM